VFFGGNYGSAVGPAYRDHFPFVHEVNVKTIVNRFLVGISFSALVLAVALAMAVS
jgi:hypothetical protein